jgi:two-component system, NarL family, nitrate/nitrite response regulator NarL
MIRKTEPAPLSPSAHRAAPWRIDVLLVDDHDLFRAGMRLILGDGPLAADMQVGRVHEAASLAQALALPEGSSVDVVLLDVQLPGLMGIEGLTLLKRRWPQAALLMLSAQQDSATVRLALQRGALAYLSKTSSPEQIRQHVRMAALGKIAPQQMHTGALGAASPEAESSEVAQSLSARQLDVLMLMCEGLSNKIIAYRLELSENTVRNHVVAILRFFGSNTRTGAVLQAQRLGLVQTTQPVPLMPLESSQALGG